MIKNSLKIFTERGILSSLKEDFITLFSGSSRKLLLWNIGTLLFIFLVSNYFTLSFINSALMKSLDTRLMHEAQRLEQTFRISGDSILFLSTIEIDEKDFNQITEHPFFLTIYSARGIPLYTGTNTLKYPFIKTDILPVEEEAYFDDEDEHPFRLRIFFQPVTDSQNHTAGFIKIGSSKGELINVVWQTVKINLYLFPLTAIVIFLISFILVRQSRKPLLEVIEKAESYRFSAGPYKIEYLADKNDILNRLKDTLNNLFERIELSFTQLRQFSDNASHQLMNPLTAIKTELDFLLKKERSVDEYTDALQTFLQQTDKMIDIVKTLLLLSRLSFQGNAQKNIFNLSKQMVEIAEFYSHTRRISSSIEPETYVRGTPEVFTVLMNNLIENALKYSPPTESVTLEVQKADGDILIKVIDCGIGVPDSEKEKIFFRFYRGKMSEEITSQGYGLGLCLAKTIALDFGGDIAVIDNTPHGAVFVLKLPSLEVQ